MEKSGKSRREKTPVAIEELDPSWIPEYQAEQKLLSPSEIPYLSNLKKGVVDEYNLARTKPKQYAAIIAEYKKFYNGRYIEIPGEIRIITHEGISAVCEAIQFLETATPCPPLTLSKGMSKAAKDHVNDIGPKSIVGHYGSDGSNPFIRMQRYGKWQKTAGENISFGKKMRMKSSSSSLSITVSQAAVTEPIFSTPRIDASASLLGHTARTDLCASRH